MKRLLAASVLAFAGGSAAADSFDNFDVFESPKRYEGGSYETTFQCIRDTLTEFLGFGGADVELIEDDGEDFISASTPDYFATVTFEGEMPESEIVRIRSTEVFRMLGDDFLSSSYVGLNDELPIISDAYNIGYEIDPAKSGQMLNAHLMACGLA
ncbi:MAG: hypothetical protein AAF549_04140 [Pseudomonadota bacterium]